MAEKYVSMSPFVYVANNPLKYIDPDGKEIWISVGNGERVQYKNGRLYKDGEVYEAEKGSFAYNTMVALSHILVHGGGAGEVLIKTLSKGRDQIGWIGEVEIKDAGILGNDAALAKGKKSTVEFSDEAGLISEKGEVASPALGLAHELGHAFLGLLGHYTHTLIVEEECGNCYTNSAEKTVIEGFESVISQAFERNGYGSFNRDHHQGKVIEVYGPLSNEARDKAAANKAMQEVIKILEPKSNKK